LFSLPSFICPRSNDVRWNNIPLLPTIIVGKKLCRPGSRAGRDVAQIQCRDQAHSSAGFLKIISEIIQSG
jgi:hypothetical protein